MKKRLLTGEEIAFLERRGCRAEDWTQVLVAEDFSPGNSFHRVRFSGRIELGSFRGVLRTADGLAFPCGIDNSGLHDVSVGNNCLITGSNVASADIGDNVVLDGVAALVRRGDGPFGNAARANVLAEDGARSVPLWRGLSAQAAHLLCHLKNHPVGLALEEMVRRDAERLRLPRSVVSSGCRLRNTGMLRNVWLGEGSLVDGAAVLEDCCVESDRAAPARIGENVAARECVFLRGSDTRGGVRLDHCLVGEGVRLSDAFSAKHSLFFANAEFSQGESSCSMTGPFAVSTHKATLILTCQCSFATFGSAANASNHHFKLGPLHGGVLRRGVKCGSGSYLFWPCDIGAFTSVLGRHSGHLDTVNFPFSLLIGKRDESVLVPGVNLFGCGAYRDAGKWRARDRRGAVALPLDLVNPDVLSPYVLQHMAAGVGLLRRAAALGGDLRHGGAVIPSARFEPALRLYEAALIFHSGERLLSRAAELAGGPPGPDDFRAVLDAASPPGAAEPLPWRDWGGMLLSGEDAQGILADVESGVLSEPEAFHARLREVHHAYGERELGWLAWRWRREYGDATDAAIAGFTACWRRAVLFRNECFVKDASKEFAAEAMIAFGVEDDAVESFRRVRGRLVDHPLLAEAEKEREGLLELALAMPGR